MMSRSSVASWNFFFYYETATIADKNLSDRLRQTCLQIRLFIQILFKICYFCQCASYAEVGDRLHNGGQE